MIKVILSSFYWEEKLVKKGLKREREIIKRKGELAKSLTSSHLKYMQKTCELVHFRQNSAFYLTLRDFFCMI